MEYLQSINPFSGPSHFPLITFPPVFQPEDAPKAAILYVLPKSKELRTSEDYECLKYQTYLMFAKYPHSVVEHSEQSFSPSGKLPALLTTDGRMLAGWEIICEVREKFDLEANLSTENRARLEVFTSLIERGLVFGLNYEFWYDSDNFEGVTAATVGASYPWPLNYFLPRFERSRRITWMLSKRPMINTEEIYGETDQILRDISLMLGTGKYFFGETYVPRILK
ncbi:hypothetical protein BASA50_009627 [Batrachochytrium salamandrivorans]|uniref:Mitochondrial outer membrane transport complex Sam37/metaxin N-terminal domain-containing protein n=1 Tax=Batrachochytrium salamandrivorans TaxID=1357716 RepID=A0ABQ8F0X8_9FUNG|nr:hypothetical protein BASA62_010108 [Batrachochytrium salamandrivorans]KAH6580024.1 hypothetical protein BASA60_003028 [Batrachochytrium salamandrivorans]KAH6581881.1 hypothetical protein BASA61_008769 [Batrachochytrium salamandrivorans]KAH6589924.1 hypothetical protein BASA50_009627 [Batrachochytrium salamandrivorans]KAH9270296.1 hypothetical protein BASA83_007635 [Batrachochytrium salamandrivorans]